MRTVRGFTLIELMIVLVVLAILVAIAYPSYDAFIIRSRRSDGQALLLDAAARQERYHYNNSSYTSTPANLGFANPALSTDGHYTLTIPAAGNTTYTLRATPTAGDPQTDDDDCGYLEINDRGQKSSQHGGGRCWG